MLVATTGDASGRCATIDSLSLAMCATIHRSSTDGNDSGLTGVLMGLDW